MHPALLPASARLERYDALAAAWLAGVQAGAEEPRRWFRAVHPRFRRPDVPWLARETTDAEVGSPTLDDLRLAVARAHDYLDWAALTEHVSALTTSGSEVQRFERALDAVVGGDPEALRALLAGDPALVHARSSRRCCFDPPVHRATLLHYLGANGVEGQRQHTPPAAVEVAEVLFAAGAIPDAVADLYGESYTPLCLLVSSSIPAEAGLQRPLIEVLVRHGADPSGQGPALGVSPLRAALVFGQPGAAEVLVELGARVDDLAVAAGLGRAREVEALWPAADEGLRHRALVLAVMHGRLEVVRWLLDRGVDPSRHNPPGLHPHTTPLHQAALAGDEGMVRLLVECGARADLLDRTYQSPAAGWADHAGHTELAAWLRARPPG